MDTDLTYFFTTKMQAQDFSSRLSSIIERMYVADFNFEKNFSEQFGIAKKDKFITLLRDNKLTPEPNVALKEFLNKLLTEIDSMPVITLKIAFTGREETLQHLAEWFILNVKKKVLFDITYDPSLIAGAAIFYEGNFVDYSIRKKFDQILGETLTNKPSMPVDAAKG